MTAFEEHASEIFAVAYRVAYRLTGDRMEAEDIAQETCARAFVHWKKISGYPHAWAARSASNLALDVLRKRSRPSPVPPSDHLAGGAERVDLVNALRRLPRRQRDVVVLRYIADLPEQAVANRLGCSVGAVKQHAHRALAALRSGSNIDLVEGPLGDA